ncbi:relaxase/mobilization nuclease domain-containing protein [Albibacterium bauzanense]|uniref:Relaxase/mobilization nuclease-like protein n=1 Tax=Albibacterium bauzanense TaxID=653929 RepID=A0A4V2PX65_9SPHI|nr:relaxase/mobilization nuclease domain-containing protein [Albibacterium bauzanense]TCK80911.1 relaxase/mobilization nuclease-like protein [Albibacterium bauzanense]
MVAKIMSGRNIAGALNYNERKVNQGKAELIGQYGFHKELQHLNFYDKLQRFTNLTMSNQRSKTNSVHISLNFAVGEQISDSKLIEIADQYMNEIGFQDQPYLVYAHNDAGHPHIHIVTTNIKSTGKRISLHNLGKTKSEEARKAIEIQYGLIPAKQAELRKTENQRLSKVNYGTDDTKRAISNVVQGVVSTYKFSSLSEFNAALSCFNVVADRGSKNSTMYAKNGLLYWALDEKGRKVGIPIKASSIYSSPTLKSLERKFESNKKRKSTQKGQLKTSIDQVMKAKASPAGFQQALSSKGINVLFRRNEEGRLYGVTFIDHNTKSVFNGSDLGKSYSANALSQWFGKTNASNPEPNTSKQNHPVPVRFEGYQRNGIPFSSDSKNVLDALMEVDPQNNSLPEGMFQNKRKKKRKRSLLNSN